MRLPLERNQLDAARCSRPGCDHAADEPLYFHSRCHPGEGLEVVYAEGQLKIACRICKAHVATVLVAE